MYTEIVVKTCGICLIKFCYSIDINVTETIFIKQYGMVQFKTGVFPLLRLPRRLTCSYPRPYVCYMQYYIWILLTYHTYKILYYIYALNLYISIPILWAVLQYNVQEQLQVCKQLYIRGQQVIKSLLTVAKWVLNTHKYWLIQSTLEGVKKRKLYSMKSYRNWRFQSVIQSDIQRPAGKWKGGKRDEHYHQWQRTNSNSKVLNFIWRNESEPLK